VESVRDNSDLHRFELVEDGHLAFAEYRIEGGVITFIHTIVPPEIGGRGVASRLIGAALEAASERGLKVVPQCSFVAAYIDRHPEWRAILA